MTTSERFDEIWKTFELVVTGDGLKGMANAASNGNTTVTQNKFKKAISETFAIYEAQFRATFRLPKKEHDCIVISDSDENDNIKSEERLKAENGNVKSQDRKSSSQLPTHCASVNEAPALLSLLPFSNNNHNHHPVSVVDTDVMRTSISVKPALSQCSSDDGDDEDPSQHYGTNHTEVQSSHIDVEEDEVTEDEELPINKHDDEKVVDDEYDSNYEIADTDQDVSQSDAESMTEKTENLHFYRQNPEGQEKRIGKWSDEEHKVLMQRIKETGVNVKWGMISKAIPGRVGYQVSDYWRQLIGRGWVKDLNYWYNKQNKKWYKGAVAHVGLAP